MIEPLHVFFTPAEVAVKRLTSKHICIVIDVIRATTSLTTILEQGARRVFVAKTLEQAQQAAQHYPNRLLCGERGALPLPDFDYGNSPTQFAQADLKDKELILTTTNGSRAFFTCPSASICLAGCFRNARAVATLALTLSKEQDASIALICAGTNGDFALDDTVCAGCIALELQRQQPAMPMNESVYAAMALYHAFLPPKLLDYCHSAHAVRVAGLHTDLDYCLQTSMTMCVPIVEGKEEETGLLILQKY